MIKITDSDADNFVKLLLEIQAESISNEKALLNMYKFLDQIIIKNKLVVAYLEASYCMYLIFLNIIGSDNDDFEYLELKIEGSYKIDKKLKKEVYYSRSIGVNLLTNVLLLEDLKESYMIKIHYKNVDFTKSRHYSKFDNLVVGAKKLDKYIKSIGHYPKKEEIIE